MFVPSLWRKGTLILSQMLTAGLIDGAEVDRWQYDRYQWLFEVYLVFLQKSKVSVRTANTQLLAFYPSVQPSLSTTSALSSSQPPTGTTSPKLHSILVGYIYCPELQHHRITSFSLRLLCLLVSLPGKQALTLSMLILQFSSWARQHSRIESFVFSQVFNSFPFPAWAPLWLHHHHVLLFPLMPLPLLQLLQGFLAFPSAAQYNGILKSTLITSSAASCMGTKNGRRWHNITTLFSTHPFYLD